MASSFRDDPYRRPNLATGGAIPSYFRAPRVPAIPPIFPTPPAPWPQPPNPIIPFPAPLPVPPHDVDPPESNPDNDPNYSPFLVTKNQAMETVDTPQGGLLGRLLAALAEQANNASNGGRVGNSDTEAATAVPRDEVEDQPVRILARRIISY
jgi:hypothetical protein